MKKNPTAECLMNFRRIGSSYQVLVRTLDDLALLVDLDEAHWALTSVYLDSVRADPQFLSFLDTDLNGIIRVDEVKQAIRWFLDVVRPNCDANLGGEEFYLDCINTGSPAGASLLAAAKVIQGNLGLAGSPSLTLLQIRNDKEIINQSCRNGDGIITPGGLEENESTAPLAELLKTIMAAAGTVTDLSGEAGINGDILKKFTAGARSYLDWLDSPGRQPELRPFGEGTEAFSDKLNRVRRQLDQYFLNSAALGFLPDRPDRLDKVEATADVLSPENVGSLLERITVAPPRADGMLDFSGPLNPLYAGDLRALSADPAMRDYIKAGQLSAADWEALKRKIASFDAWRVAKPDDPTVSLEPDMLRRHFADGSFELLQKMIDADLAVSGELSEYQSLLKLLLFHRHLLAFLNNYACLSALFNPAAPSMLQAGRLVMDGRHFTLAMPVRDVDEHKRIATVSNICVLYVEATTGPSASTRTMTLAVAVTSGNMRNLFIGKRGVFLTTGGSWQARVVDFIQQPVSISEAFRMPFYRFGEFLGKQADKFFSTKSVDAQKALEGQIAAGPSPAAAGKPGQAPAVSGSMLLMGGGIGLAAVGSSVAFIAKQLQNISILNVLAVLFGIVLIFGGPMVVISLVKLYRRSITRYLEANGCAVNRMVRLSHRMGLIFTCKPPIPSSSLIREDLIKLFNPAGNRGRKVVFALLILAMALLCGLGGYYAFYRLTRPKEVKSELRRPTAPVSPPVAEPPAAAPAAAPAS